MKLYEPHVFRAAAMFIRVSRENIVAMIDRPRYIGSCRAT